MTSTDPRHRLGALGEDLAAAHLERLGYRVLARNHRTRYGELDVVALDRATIVFCEVKTRREGPWGPWEMLDERKRAQVRRMARDWLASVSDRPRAASLRCDAIGVVVDARGRLVRLDHLEDAFLAWIHRFSRRLPAALQPLPVLRRFRVAHHAGAHRRTARRRSRRGSIHDDRWIQA